MRLNTRLGISVLFCVTYTAFSQSTSGNFVGAVTDSSSGAVPRAKLTLTRQETGLARTTQSDDQGSYEFRIVEPGTYTVAVEAAGFKKYANKDLVLAARETRRIDVRLEVGALTESVTVNSEAPVINTESAQIGETRSSKLLVEGPQGTPIMARFGLNTAQWSLTIRGGTSPESNYKSMGSRPTMWEAAVDGNAVEASWVGPPTEAIAEEKNVVINASAEQRAPVVIDAVTKQGTNQVHGSFTGSLTHAAFNALAAGPPNRRRGASVPRKVYNITGGGPVYIPKIYDGRNKTFWFISAERNPRTDTNYFLTQYIDAASVPTAAMRNGDFSRYLAKAKPNLQLTNPLTGMPFAGNVIPRAAWNQASVKAVDQFYPVPNISQVNDPDLPFRNLEYKYNEVGTFSQWFWRVDQKISDKNTAGFSYTSRPLIETGQHAGWWGLLPTTGRYFADRRAWDYAWRDTHVFSPTVVNEFKLGWYRAHNQLGGTQPASTVIGGLGINLGGDAARRTALNVIPDINITGYDRIGGLYDQTDELFNWWNIRNNLSWNKGKHTLKFGYDHRFKHYDADNVQKSAAGNWSFTGRFTGDAFADFVLGLPEQTVRFTPRPKLLARYNEFGFFVQDDFKFSRNLTLNIGVRIDRIGARTDAGGAHYNFNPRTGALVVPNEAARGLINPAFPRSIPVEMASQASYPGSLVNPWFAFTPRFGLAWRPGNSNARVFRLGYGVFSTDAGAQGNNFALLQGGGPFALSETFINSLTSGTPLVTLDRPFPAASGNVPATFNIAGVNPGLRTPYMQQWNVSVEQQIGTWALRASYVGAKSTHLTYTRNINKPAPSLIPFTTSRLLYRGFNNINWFDSGGNSRYHSAQFQFTHRFRGGLLVDGLFMWSNEIADLTDGGGPGVGIENPYNRSRDRAKAFIDSVDFRASFIYQFPFGKGRKFAASANRVLHGLIGEWEFSGIVDARNGRPETVIFAGADPSNTGTFGGRASLASAGCNTRPGQGRFDFRPYLAIGCFAVPTAGDFGNLGRGILRKPGSYDFSGSLYKFFTLAFLRDDVKLRFSATIGNLFNHPTWNNVGNNISVPASFGQLSGQGAFGRRSGARSIALQGQVQF
jgi:hypothetical protein